MDVNDTVIRILDDDMKREEQIKALMRGPAELLGAISGPAEQLKRQMELAGSLGLVGGTAADLISAPNGPSEQLKRQLDLSESLGVISGPVPELIGIVNGPTEQLKQQIGLAESLGITSGPADDMKNMAVRMGLGPDIRPGAELRSLTTLNEDVMRNVFEAPSPLIEPIAPLPKMDGGLASGFHERLTEMINEFENNLDADFEVGVRLVSFGHTVTFHLSDIGYWNPFLIWFEGETESGDPVKLVQHVNQISILLMKLPRRPDKPRTRVGFRSSE